MSNSEKAPRPWDIFNKNIEKVSTDIADERFNICKQCPNFIKSTTQCKECGCIMKQKVKLPNAACPIGKWNVVRIGFREEI